MVVVEEVVVVEQAVAHWLSGERILPVVVVE